jgi:Flp pilus assembly protein TadG
MRLSSRLRDTRGAVLVNAAGILLALIVLTGLVFDYGVQFVGRNQVQNAADAAAHSAAVSLSFIDSNDTTQAQNAAVAAATQNQVWGGAPDVLTTDITFPACPPGAPGVANTCVRAEVFRTSYNRGNGSPLPTFFAGIIGVANQGVRANATAQMLAGNGTADCVKPWGLPDRWVEVLAPADEFNRYYETGPNRGQLLPNPDYYDPAQGYALPRDYGVQVTLYTGGPGNAAIQPGFFQPVVVDPNCSQGAACYEAAIRGCVTEDILPGDVLQPEPGRMTGPTRHGFEDLIAQDQYATWAPDPDGAGPLRAGPTGGCFPDTCSRSPRWIAVPVFDVDAYIQARLQQAGGPGGGRNLPINVIKVIGLWLEQVRPNNQEIVAYITHYPTLSITGGTPVDPESAFARTVILVR